MLPIITISSDDTEDSSDVDVREPAAAKSAVERRKKFHPVSHRHIYQIFFIFFFSFFFVPSLLPEKIFIYFLMRSKQRSLPSNRYLESSMRPYEDLFIAIITETDDSDFDRPLNLMFQLKPSKKVCPENSIK